MKEREVEVEAPCPIYIIDISFEGSYKIHGKLRVEVIRGHKHASLHFKDCYL